MNKLTFNTPCFTIHTGEIVESTLGDHKQHISTTTRPTGIGPVYDMEYCLKNSHTENEKESWCIYRYYRDGKKYKIREFDNEKEAKEFLEDLWCVEISENSEYTIFATRESAEFSFETCFGD